MQKKIPIECCLTSNILCGTVKKLEDHHFKKLFDMDYPVIICVSIQLYSSIVSFHYLYTIDFLDG